MALNSPPKPNRCLAVFVRHPEPGKVKTRLAKAYGDPFAAELYGYFVDDLLEALAPGSYHLEIFFTPAEREMEIRRRFGVRFRYIPQEGEGIGDRMGKAFRSCFAKGFATTLLIGSDFPDLTAEVIEQAFQNLENGHDAVVGPACDGGYYLVGLAREQPGLFVDIDWGTGLVLEQTRAAIARHGLSYQLLPCLADVDRPVDLAAWTG